MTSSLATVSYIGATILFILSLGGLSNPETARRGNLFGIIGMTVAVLATVLGPRVGAVGIPWIVGALVVGGAIGLFAAKKVQMTQMPELVALMHSLVGLAACLVGFASYVDTSTVFPTPAEKAIHEVEIYVGILIGAVTFSGSLIAFGKLSGKVSGVQDLVSVYRALAQRCDYALHLGLTEAGMGTKGTVASATALSLLLQDGIGDTIRVSLTPQPGEPRTQEVVIASEILQSLGLRAFVPSVTACPGCGRTTSTTFQELAKQIDDFLRAQMPVWRNKYPGVEKLKVAVMGCIVNGPGESKHADIGISLPGTGEAPAAPVFIDGEKALTLRGDNIASEFHQLVESYIEKRYGSPVAADVV